MALLWRVSTGDTAARTDCCGGCEAGIGPPALGCLRVSGNSLFIVSACSVFVFRLIFPPGNRNNPLSSGNYTISGNLSFFQRTLVAAAVARVSILNCVCVCVCASLWCPHTVVMNAAPSGAACWACWSGLPTFSTHIVNSTSPFQACHNDGRAVYEGGGKNHYRAPGARFILINGCWAREEPSLRHLQRWADEHQ